MPGHLIIAAAPGKGHMGPCISLASQFWRLGKTRVTLVLPLTVVESIPLAVPLNQPNITVIRLDIPQEERALGAVAFLDENKEKVVSDILSNPSLDIKSVVGVVCDMFAPVWGSLLGSVLHVPSYVFVPSPLTFVWTAQNLDEICERRDKLRPIENKQSQPGHEAPPVGSFTIEIPGVGFVDSNDIPDEPPEVFKSVRRHCRTFPTFSGILCQDVFSAYPNPNALIQDIHSTYRKTHGRSLPIYSVGCLALFDARLTRVHPRAPELCWLDAQPDRSVVFAALGSWCQLPTADVRELAMGLKESGSAFLWAYRPRRNFMSLRIERVCDTPTEPNGLPVGFVDSLDPCRQSVAEWVNQPAVLRHPALSGVVTHCGWNSSLECLGLSGRPMILLPITAEQGVNSVVLEKHWKCGQRLWAMDYDRELDKNKVSQIIKNVVASAALRSESSRLQSLISQAILEGGEVFEDHQLFLSSLFK